MIVRTGKLVIHLDTKRVEVDGKLIRVPGQQYQILELLALNKGRMVTKEMFFHHLYPDGVEVQPKILDVLICNLRKTLNRNGVNYIETIWAQGFKLRDEAVLELAL